MEMDETFGYICVFLREAKDNTLPSMARVSEVEVI